MYTHEIEHYHVLNTQINCIITYKFAYVTVHKIYNGIPNKKETH